MEIRDWGAPIRTQVAYAHVEGLQLRLWVVVSDVRDAGTTGAYDRWFA